jgi:hypothetical protein
LLKSGPASEKLLHSPTASSGKIPAELTAELIKARLGGDGPTTEHRVLLALNAIKGYAQVELADDAIAIVETVTKHANEVALATIRAWREGAPNGGTGVICSSRLGREARRRILAGDIYGKCPGVRIGASCIQPDRARANSC